MLSLNNRALAYLGLGRGKEAIADLTHSIELDDHDASAYATRGSAYITIGDKEKALADLDKSIDMGAIVDPIQLKRISELVEKGRRVTLHCECLVDGKVVLDGQALVMAPSKAPTPRPAATA